MPAKPAVLEEALEGVGLLRRWSEEESPVESLLPFHPSWPYWSNTNLGGLGVVRSFLAGVSATSDCVPLKGTVSNLRGAF